MALFGAKKRLGDLLVDAGCNEGLVKICCSEFGWKGNYGII